MQLSQCQEGLPDLHLQKLVLDEEYEVQVNHAVSQQGPLNV